MSEILLLVLGFAALIAGGELLVRGAAGLALKAKISPMIVGLTIVSLGTSAPELFASVRAALMGNPDISVGNVIGSNIANLGLVLGITVLIFPIPVDRSVLKKEWIIMILATLAFFFLSYDNNLGLLDGLLLVACIVAFTGYLMYKGVGKHEMTATEAQGHKKHAKYGFWVLAGLIIFGCLGLYFGSEWFLEGSIDIAQRFGVSDHVIGVTLVAFGTSIPELAASGIAAFRRQTDISLGNLIGSNIFNIFAVLGITAIVNPLSVDDHILHNDFFWMLGIALLLFPIMLVGSKITRFNGVLLLATYAVYIIMLFWYH